MSFKIRDKLLGGFGTVILLTLLIAFVGFWSMSKVSKNIYNICDNLFPASTQAKELDSSVWMASSNLKALIFSKDNAQAKEAADIIDIALNRMAEISDVLKEKFSKKTEITSRIKNLDAQIERLMNLKEKVYKTVLAGFENQINNDQIKARTLLLVDSTIASIAEQVDNVEFEIMLAKGSAKKGIKSAIEATESMSKSYNDLSQINFPTVRRLLTMKASFYEAVAIVERIISLKKMERLPIHEDKFIAAMTHIKGRLENLKTTNAVDIKKIVKIQAASDNYRNLVLGNLKKAVEENIKQQGTGKSAQISLIEEELGKNNEEMISLIDGLVDDFEFSIMVDTASANKSIKEGLEKTKSIDKSYSKIVDETMPLTKALFLLRGDIAMATATVEGIINCDNLDLLVPLQDKFSGQMSSGREQLAVLTGLIGANEINNLKKFLNQMESFILGQDGILKMRRMLLMDLKESENIAKEVEGYIKQINEMVKTTVDEVNLEAQQASDTTRQVVGSSSGSIGISSLVVILLGLTIAILLSKFIVQNLNTLNALLNKWVVDLARRKGDLTERLHMKTNDELSAVGNSFDSFMDSFADMTKVIKKSSGKIDSSAKNFAVVTQQANASLQSINTSIQEISRGAVTQVSKIEETGKIIDGVMVSLKQIDVKAKEVTKIVIVTSDLADKGKQENEALVKKMIFIASVVQKTAAAVKELGKRSEKIGEISDTINSFADQTNLLALNAAIEAARAGEAGRGFAVVAEEVRKLAEGSSKSAKKITDLIQGVQGEVDTVVTLIEDGQKETEEGRKIAEQANEVQSRIAEASKSVAKMVSEISRIIPEQLKGTERVVEAISEISCVSQENASSTEQVSSSTQEMSASMEELTSSADDLVVVVGQLQEQVGQFVVK
ncbi:MAG: methyl-accepting chemotaxis protein [Candidatus Omnitrophota bacterium]